MNTVAEQVASHLLQIKAIKLEPNHPFTWASGWKSPIYCDNRKTLSYPEVRTYIRDQFVNLIKTKYPQVELIAGVATGAIAQGALVAQELGLPFVYVRSAAKNHGLENLIEGEYKEGQKGEDLNIIFIVDNSSSMNQTAGTAYVNKEQWCPIAPSDREKTKIANAKKAIANFIDNQNGKNTDMRVITFNTSSTEEKSNLKTLKEKVDESQVRDFMDGKYANINN